MFLFHQGMVTSVSATLVLLTGIVTLYTGAMGVACCIDPYVVFQARLTSAKNGRVW